MAMEAKDKWLCSSQMAASMLAVQVFATGQQLLSKVILNQGTFIFSFMAYRHLVAALCVAPFAFFLERADSKKLAWSTWFWLFINALTGITVAMGLFFYGLRDTTATYSTNFLNVIPIVTFVLSILLRMEKLGLDSKAGKIKTVGTIICVGGALTTSLYKGKAFYLTDRHHHFRSSAAAAMEVSSSQWTRGTFMLVGEVAASIPVKIPGNADNMHLGVRAIGSNRPVFGQARVCLEIRVELAASYYSLLGSTEYGSNILLTDMGDCEARPYLRPHVQPAVPNIRRCIRSSGTRVVGTVMIIFGLYSFLWGRREETKLFGKANAGDEALTKPVPATEEMQMMKTFETSPVNVKSVYAAMEEGALKDIVKS
ncbi:hypothetical protein V6N11_028492 [Hibiscus sabdariffa]|uniref:WAT1-related protein n=2 Tax=Hibiscus sabdariffa TaxID=183260 RepID=A0ABR2B707_9ROSI